MPHRTSGAGATSAAAGHAADDHPPASASPAAANPRSGDAEAARAAAAAHDRENISSLLQRYERGYGTLDVDAVAAVWPSVDRAALARAFAELQSQRLTLDRCRVNVEGASGTAACQGYLRTVRRAGSVAPLEQALQWTFQLERHGSGWVIRSMRTAP